MHRYAQFRARLTRARAEGELNLVRKLDDDPDWRAAAFLLERGYRERWGKEEPQQSSVTITLTDEQLAALNRRIALRTGARRDATHRGASDQQERRDTTKEVGSGPQAGVCLVPHLAVLFTSCHLE